MIVDPLDLQASRNAPVDVDDRAKWRMLFTSGVSSCEPLHIAGSGLGNLEFKNLLTRYQRERANGMTCSMFGSSGDVGGIMMFCVSPDADERLSCNALAKVL